MFDNSIFVTFSDDGNGGVGGASGSVTFKQTCSAVLAPAQVGPKMWYLCVHMIVRP